MLISRVQTLISKILTTGTLLAASVVLIGGILFLYQQGQEPISILLAQPNLHLTSLPLIWQAAITFSPLGIIAIGVLILIVTQLLRVALLVWYYQSIHDRYFTIISLFVLCVLLYSFFGQH